MRGGNRCVSAAAGILVVAAFLVVAGSCRAPERRNLLVVTFDTTRADALGCYGRADARTPNLDRLAAEGVLFADCVSAAPITLPSHSTIFTGLYPVRHGVRDNGIFSLSDECLTLAEILQREGYATGAAIASFPLLARFGTDQGFDTFDDHITVEYENARGVRVDDEAKIYFDERPAERVNDAILPWLRNHHKDPFFAWVHYFDPHRPYRAPAPYDQLFANDPYLAEIAYADECLGRLLAELEILGVADDTVVVVVADHGEGCMDHGELTHSLLSYDSTLNVPLIIRDPRLARGVRVARRVGTVDILPTVLELLDVATPVGLDGRSLVPVVQGHAPVATEPPPYYAETLSPRLSNGWGELRTLYDGQMKYIHGPTPELFDLASDPAELHNLVADRPRDVSRLRSALQAWLDDMAPRAVTSSVLADDPETMARLAALGYLVTGRDDPAGITETLLDGGIAPQQRVGDVNDLSNAKQMVIDRRYLTARELALRLLENDPENPMYLAVLAMAQVGMGAIDEAVETAFRADRPSASGASLYQWLGATLFERGDTVRGLELMKRSVAAARGPSNLYSLARMYNRLGREEEYEAGLRECLELDDRFAPARVGLAVFLAEDGRLREAEERFLEVAAEHPLFAPGHYNYGKFLFDNGRLSEAAVHLERAVELYPAYCQARYVLLVAYLSLGQEDAARETYSGLIQACRGTPYLAGADARMETLQ